MPIARKAPPRPKIARRAADDAAAELRTGTGPYAVIADYRLACGGDWCSCVVRQCNSRAEARRMAEAESKRIGGSARVEYWSAASPLILAEFGGPSPALTALVADLEGYDCGIAHRAEAEVELLAKRIGRHLADLPRNLNHLRAATGCVRSDLIAALQWGLSRGYWAKHPMTRHWLLTDAGRSFAAPPAGGSAS